MWECIWACGLQERALDRETGHRGPRTCTALAGIREQGKTGPAQLVKAVIFLSQQSSLSASHDPGNHSCVPNAETSFPENNFLLHVTALEDIKPGEVRGASSCGGGWAGGLASSPQESAAAVAPALGSGCWFESPHTAGP